MNEEYMKRFQKQPGSQFIEKVGRRLERKEKLQVVKKYSFSSLIALMFVFALLMTFSSHVRADVISIIETIGGLDHEVTINYPGGPEEEVTIVPDESWSLDEAQARFPSPISLPTYIPEGYERQTDVRFMEPGFPVLTIRWDSKEKGLGGFDLVIGHCSPTVQKCGSLVGEGALEEILLNGKPATFIRGAWNYDKQQYDLSVMRSIQWVYDENTVYTLQFFSSDLSMEELIKIAESIP